MASLLSLLRYSKPLRRSFGGSLRYIDSLPNYVPRRPAPAGLRISKYSVGRNTSAIAIASRGQPLGGTRTTKVMPLQKSKSNFLLLGDNRSYHPLGKFRPLLAFNKIASTWQAPSKPDWERQDEIIRKQIERAKRQLEPGHSVFRRQGNLSDTLASLKFSMPSSLVICAKRKIRREILHAFGIAGMASRLFKPPKYNINSKVRCI